jgi:hypothetical protein
MHVAVQPISCGAIQHYCSGNQPFFVLVPPDENSLQLHTPKVVV